MRCIIAAYSAPAGMASLCDAKHGGWRGERLGYPPMEWMLQVVDDIDDAICVVRHRLLGLCGELGMLIRYDAAP
jgi:hypothetical protein